MQGRVFLGAIFFAVSSLAMPADRAGDLYSQSTESCIDAYYGIGQPMDYVKAYKCFQSQHIYPYLIVMQLNGEGTPADLKEAQQTMQVWLSADPDNAQSLDETQMQSLLSTREVNPDRQFPKVDYCKDVAGTTYSVSFCAWVRGQIQQQGLQSSMAAIRAKLDSGDQALWDEIQKTFRAFLDAEGERGGQLYAGGSIRGDAYTEQQIGVRHDFQELMGDVFRKQALAPASKDDLKKAEEDLRETYAEDLAAYKDEYSLSYEPDSGDFNATMKQYVEEYEADTKKSQQLWEKLRDQCARMAANVYKGKQLGVDWAGSMKAAMTRIRAAEIRNAGRKG